MPASYRVGLRFGRTVPAPSWDEALRILMEDFRVQRLDAVRLIRVDRQWTGVEFECCGVKAGVIYCPASFAAKLFPDEPLFDCNTGAKT